MTRAFALVPALLLGLGGAALASCPPNYVGPLLTSPGGTPIIAAVHRDSACAGPCYWKSNWNNTVGSAHCEGGQVPCDPEHANYGDVGQYTSDDFVLTGPSGPNPVAFQALLHLVGSSPASGYVTASLGDGTQSVSSGQVTSLNTALTLSLSKIVGDHFHLDRSLYARAYCSGNAIISSQLEIVLPPGYGMTSCYGFSAAGPTPALRTSWGSMKSVYR